MNKILDILTENANTSDKLGRTSFDKFVDQLYREPLLKDGMCDQIVDAFNHADHLNEKQLQNLVRVLSLVMPVGQKGSVKILKNTLELFDRSKIEVNSKKYAIIYRALVCDFGQDYAYDFMFSKKVLLKESPDIMFDVLAELDLEKTICDNFQNLNISGKSVLAKLPGLLYKNRKGFTDKVIDNLSGFMKLHNLSKMFEIIADKYGVDVEKINRNKNDTHHEKKPVLNFSAVEFLSECS